jgi:hypothetical protein
MKRLPFIIYDFETSSSDPRTCYPLEVAAVVVDSRELEYIDGSLFVSYMRPAHLDTLEKVMSDETIQDRALEVNGINRADIHTFPEEKLVWNNFVNHCLKYAVGRSDWDRGIAVGWNIHRFDDIITERLCAAYKTKKPFNRVHRFDLMNDWLMWAENLSGEHEVERFNFPDTREYLGMPDLTAERGSIHTGKRDILDCGDVFIRFQKWRRQLAYHKVNDKKVPRFKGSFANENK